MQFIENQRIFYKKVWEISGFNDAVEEYMDDLKGSISSKFIDVQEDVEREVNGFWKAIEESNRRETDTTETVCINPGKCKELIDDALS